MRVQVPWEAIFFVFSDKSFFEYGRMKKYQVVTPETLVKIAECFTDSEEMITFTSQMEGLVEELIFNSMLRKRVPSDSSAVLLLKQTCVFGLFCREHMDLIHQIVKNLECKQMTEEEIKEMNEDLDE